MKLPEVVEQLEKHPDLHLYFDKIYLRKAFLSNTK